MKVNTVKNKKVVKKPKNLSNSTLINVGNLDYTALLVITLLLIIGIVMIFSAGLYWTVNVKKDPFFLLKKQTFFVIVGYSMMMFMSYFNYRALMKFAIPSYIIVNLMLVAVALFGVVDKGAARSIRLPVIGEIQPLEFAKISTILMISYIIYRNKNILKEWTGFFIVCSILGLTSFLVLLGSLSSAIIVTSIGMGIIFVASPYTWRFIFAFIGGLASVGAAIILTGLFGANGGGFRFARIQAWLDPFAYASDKGYQIVNSLYAISSGGPFGVGIGQSRQKSFIPEPFNDFIFAVIVEELGYIGASLIIVLFGILIWRGVRIAINAPDLFGSLVATGIIIMISSQVVINIAVVTNTMPNTGIPLPFISYGGSSLMVTMFLMGVLLNISRYSKG